MCSDKLLGLHDLEFSIRTENVLLRNGINNIDDLLQYTREDLLGMRYIGKRTLAEIVGKLSARGYSLKPSGNNPESQA